MISHGTGNPNDQPLYDRLWGSGFLPTQAPGGQVPLRSAIRCSIFPIRPGCRRGRPPARCSTTWRELNQLELDEDGDPEIATRIAAIRTGLPHADVGARADRPLERAEARLRPVRSRRRASPARSPPTACLARRLAERGRAVHPALPPRLGPAREAAGPDRAASAATPTRPSAALITDLKQRGLLDDTLVVWGGEFGRTVYCQGTSRPTDYGRDHHPRCFTDLAGRRRHQAGHDVRRDRRLLLQHRPATRSTSTTCTPRCCIAWASTTRG